MIIESLKLNNFRNFKTLNIHFTKGINFLYGKNGSGKTNIVEAIYFKYGMGALVAAWIGFVKADITAVFLSPGGATATQ